ncbi:hypothetical protein EJB05_05062, partial [Eragrostis curvula]
MIRHAGRYDSIYSTWMGCLASYLTNPEAESDLPIEAETFQLMSTIRATVILVVITLGVGGAVARATDPIDVRAMQAIAKSIGADKSLGWGVKSGDPCDGTWPGVRCDKDLGRVTAIDASNGGLTGTISGTDLSDLTYLSSLDLMPQPPRHRHRLPRATPTTPPPDLSQPQLQRLPRHAPLLLARLPRAPDIRHGRQRGGHGHGILSGRPGSLPRAQDLLGQQHGPLRKVKFLDISNQSFGGDKQLLGRLDFVTGMMDLVEIHVRDNLFDGPLPDVSGLANLKVFDAANNNLCGRLNFPSGVAVNVDGNPGVGKDCP